MAQFFKPKFYEHFKAAAKVASDLFHNDPSRQQGFRDEKVCNMLKLEPSFVSCVGYLMEDLTIERLKNLTPEERREEITRTLIHHIKNYLNFLYIGDNIGDFFKEFSEQMFDEYYAEYERYLYSDRPMKYCIVAPLENVNYTLERGMLEDFLKHFEEVGTVILSDSIRILLASNEFYYKWNEEINLALLGFSWQGIDPEVYGGYCKPDFLLEIDYEMEKGKVPSQCKERIEFDAQEKVKEVLKILRLFKEGDLRWSWLGWSPKTPCDPPHSDDILLHFCGNYQTPNKYSLQEGEVEGLRLLYQKYIKTSDKKDFPDSAIKCFDEGIKEDDFEKKLFNFVRSLESLLVPGGQEISDKLANRVAFFLEENPQNRQEVFKDVQKAYSLRSHISHGRLEKVDELECRDYAKKMERYARRAISLWLEWIEKGYKTKDIYEAIDSKRFGM